MSSVNIHYLPLTQLPLPVRNQIEEMLGRRAHAGSHLCVALAGSHVLGFCASRILHHFARIDTLMVHEAHQQTKLPQVLLQHSLRQMHLANVLEVNTTIQRDQLELFLASDFIEETITLPFMKTSMQESIELVQPNLGALERSFSDLIEPNQHAISEPTQQQLGLRDKGIAFDNRTKFEELGKLLFASAKRRIWLMCETLDDPILNDKENVRMLKELSLRHNHAEVRILLARDRQHLKGYRPIIDLAHKLSSFIQIRKLHEERIDSREWIYLCDGHSTILRKREFGFKGSAHIDNPAIAERSRFQLDQKWQHSVPSVEIRRLVI